MRVTEDLLQRAIVWGQSRAFATSPTQSVVADSIDVLLPGQRVRELHAIRSASAEGTPDTARFVLTDRDRLTGDTIIALFDSIPLRDTVSRPRIHRLRAIGHATSLRHVPANDSTLCVPMVVYSRGRLIDVRFKIGAIDTVQVVDVDKLANGVQLEPKPDSANRCVILRAGAGRPPRAPAPAPATPPRTVPAVLPSPAPTPPVTRRKP